MAVKRFFIYPFLIRVLLGGYFYFFNNEQYSLVPLNDKIAFDTYHEGDSLVHSYSNAKMIDGNELVLKYRLNEKLQEPFAALFLYIDDSVRSFFDFSSYDAIKLKIHGVRAKRIPITFTLNYEGFTNWNEDLTNMPFTYLLDLNDKGEYDLAIHDFEIPSWWLRLHHLKKEDFESIDLTRVNYFVIGSCQLLAGGIEDSITVENVMLYNSNNTLKIIFLIVLILLILGIVIYEVSKRRKKIIVPVVGLANNEDQSEVDEIAVLINYIAENYFREDLKVEDVESATKIKARRIGELLKDELETNFKNYLNVVRISEVKRLLESTNLSISEIAYKTGYSNISHFNRVFKKELNCSPKQYREKKQQFY